MRYHIDDDRLSRLLGISRKTLERRRHSSDKPLSPGESDCAFRVARIGALAEDVFENEAVAVDWLNAANPALGGAAPLELLDTDIGIRRVEDILLRIEYGGVA